MVMKTYELSTVHITQGDSDVNSQDQAKAGTTLS